MPTSVLSRLSEAEAEHVLAMAAVRLKHRKQAAARKPYPIPELRGDALTMWDSEDRELMYAGPAETGKTFACLHKLNMLALKYPGMQGAIVRKTYASMHGSVLQTYRRILGRDTPVHAYGGEKPEWFDYPNGSRVFIGGMDNPQKVLSSERDIIYCFVGDTPVESPSPILKAYEREYSGPLVTIRTANGNQLTGTPNHPILTDKGWVALGALKVGGYVVSRSRSQEVAVGDPDENHRPSTIAEVTRALAHSETMGTVTDRVMGMDMDFHGDGWQGYVDIVSTRRQFESASQPAFSQPLGEHDVTRRNLDTLFLKGLCSRLQIPFVPRLTSRGTASDFSERLDPLRVALPSLVSSLAPSERAQAAPTQFGFQCGVAQADRSGYGVETSLPIEVTLDSIVHVSRTNVSSTLKTHVYNLQTEYSYFVASNIIAHNCNQAEELTLDDWETLTTRATGRGSVMPYTQIYGDCNPGPATHWILSRESMRRLHSRHEDNPTLFTPEGEITEQGRRTMQVLDALTGSRYKRLRLGLWVGAEGMVYEGWDASTHLIDPIDIPDTWARYRVIDFGYTNPFVCQWWAQDEDGRLYMYRELYQTQRLVEDWAAEIIRWSEGETIYETLADHDAEDRATLEARGLYTRPANKDVSPGIQAVQSRLKIAGDGKARLFIFRGARVNDADPLLQDRHKPTCTAEEFDGYVWAKVKTDNTIKEEPRKQDDHGLDALRYLVYYLDEARSMGFY